MARANTMRSGGIGKCHSCPKYVRDQCTKLIDGKCKKYYLIKKFQQRMEKEWEEYVKENREVSNG